MIPVGEKNEPYNDPNSETDLSLNTYAQFKGTDDSLEHEIPETLSSRLNSKLSYMIRNNNNSHSQLSHKPQGTHLTLSSCHNLHPTIN